MDGGPKGEEREQVCACMATMKMYRSFGHARDSRPAPRRAQATACAPRRDARHRDPHPDPPLPRGGEKRGERRGEAATQARDTTRHSTGRPPLT